MFALVGLVACHDDDDSPSAGANSNADVVNVTVIFQKEERQEWEGTINWFLENLKIAQAGMERPIELNLTYIHEDSEDFDTFVSSVSSVSFLKDSDIDAIVGPSTSKCARRLASAISSAYSKDKDSTIVRRPIISPTATGISYQKVYSTKNFIWNMAECDISQLETIINRIASVSPNDIVELVTKATDEKSDDLDAASAWFGFLATEYGLTPRISFYNNEDDVRQIADKFCDEDYTFSEDGPSHIIFDPTSTAITLAFNDELEKQDKSYGEIGHNLYLPTIYCTDNFISDSVRVKVDNISYSGLGLYPAPGSGFHLMYRTRFGKDVLNGEAQLYDALMLVAMAAKHKQVNGGTLNEAIGSLTHSEASESGDWTATGIRHCLDEIATGATPTINGASGKLYFVNNGNSGLTGTCYRLWNLLDHQYVTTGVFSNSDNKRTYSSTDRWRMIPTILEEFYDQDDSNYPIYQELQNKWAIVIAASYEIDKDPMGAYRFQADAFAVYQILKQSGFDDDHIILICQDDVAYCKSNKEPGVLRVTSDGANVYDPEAIDYILSDITTDDFVDILLGNKSDKLPRVIESTANDNVFFFWSGHGSSSSFTFGGATMPHTKLVNAIKNMPHRKMMMAIESCYSGGFGEMCEKERLPGLLVMTAATNAEESNADGWDLWLGAYRTNGFTQGLLKALDSNPAISMINLYKTVAKHTVNSHPQIYGNKFYGDIRDESMTEYLGARATNKGVRLSVW